MLPSLLGVLCALPKEGKRLGLLGDEARLGSFVSLVGVTGGCEAAAGVGVSTLVRGVSTAAVGAAVGAVVGSAVSSAVGSAVGLAVGSAMGAAVGSAVGAAVGSTVGSAVAAGTGAGVGARAVADASGSGTCLTSGAAFEPACTATGADLSSVGVVTGSAATAGS